MSSKLYRKAAVSALVLAGLLGATVYAAEPANRLSEMLRDYHRNYEEYDWVDLDPDPAMVELGRNLFFDPRLSRSGTQSCASCHNPALGWGDGLPVGSGHGMEQLGRRSPTILNTAFAAVLMWDGRAADLEEQALGPIQAGVEMNMPLDLLLDRLGGIEGYGPLFASAFENDPSISPERIAKAIAAYETTVISGEAPFDRWVAGDEDAVSEAAKRGFELFNTTAKCSSCHDSWRFTDDSFHDIGLDTDDLGRGALLPDIAVMRHAFKTPTLRNVDQRAPYMHAGQLASLRDVVVHYNDGGAARPSRSSDVGKLGLSEQDVDDIVAFMLTLTSNDGDVVIPVLPH